MAIGYMEVIIQDLCVKQSLHILRVHMDLDKGQSLILNKNTDLLTFKHTFTEKVFPVLTGRDV